MNQAGKGRAAETTAAIERAALDLVLEHGHDGVTVDMIATRVGISQRTFFNHFPTKDDALLGSDLPRVDEQAARRFVLSDGPLLLDALSLIHFPLLNEQAPRLDDRMRAIAGSQSLMSRQLERVSAIEAELREIIDLRIEHERPDATPKERADEAAMVTHLLSGVIRFIGFSTGNGRSELSEVVERTRTALEQVLRDSRIVTEDHPA